MASAFLCNICQDYHAISDMRALPCGHTNCAECIGRYIANLRLVQNRRMVTFPCPTCRTSFRATQPHPIFLEHINQGSQAEASGSNQHICHSHIFHQRVATALRVVTRLEEDQRRQTVQRAAQELEKVSEMMDSRDCLLNLFRAVITGWRGMVSLFTTIATQREQLVRLSGKLDEANVDIARAERIADQAVRTSEETLPTLRRTQGELREAKTRLDELEKIMRRKANEQQAEIQRKTEEVGRLHDQLRALKTHELKQKEDIRKLREKNKEQARLLQSSVSQYGSVQESQRELEILPPEPHDGSDHDSHMFECQSTSARKRSRPEDDDFLSLDSENAPPGFIHPLSQLSRAQPPARRHEPVPVKGPVFASGWQLPMEQVNRGSGSRMLQRSMSAATNPFALKLDEKGKPLAPVQVGSRKRAKF